MSALIGVSSVGTPGPDTFQGGIGDDTYSGLDGRDFIYGSDGDDLLVGGNGDDDLNGDGGSDTLYGDDGYNFLHGGPGDDLLVGGGWGTAGYYSATGGVVVDLRIVGPQAIGGGAGLDTLVNINAVGGSLYNDTLTGNDRGNYIAGLAGDDLLDGGAGFDTVEYYEATGGVTVNLNLIGPQNVGGGHGVDTIQNFENVSGSFFADTLTGTAASNYFVTRGGGDRVDGGAGFDTVDFRDLTGGVTVNLNQPGANATSADGADTLISIEGVVGSNFADTLAGTAEDNYFHPRGGADRVDGGGGFDTVDFRELSGPVNANLGVAVPVATSNDGVDRLISVEALLGSSFNDTLTGDAGRNNIAGQAGDDLLDGGGGEDSVDFYDATGGVTVDLNLTGAQSVGGGHGVDTIVNFENVLGSFFADTLTGTAGKNYFHTRGGGDRVDGGGGFDTVDFRDLTGAVTVDLSLAGPNATSINGVDTLISIEGLIGTTFADTLTGTSEDNYFNPRGGGDRVDGGAGFDTIDFRELSGPVNANLSLAAPTATSVHGVDTLISVEALVGSGFNDTLTGDAGRNNLAGRGGNDLLDGGGGEDSVDYYDAAGGVNVNLSLTGAQAVGGGDGLDTIVNVENILGSLFNDTLRGDGGANHLSGRAGDDTLDGGGGVDTAGYYDANTGVRVSLAITGAQSVGADQGVDVLSSIENLQGGLFNDTLTGNASNNFFNGEAGDDSMFGGDGSDNLFGGAGADVLNGGDGADSVQGAAGNDTVQGGLGDDQLFGGQGDDSIEGGAGSDMATYFNASAGVSVSLAIGGAQAVGADQGADVLTNVELLFGSNFNDTLTGDAIGNFLGGAGGDDSLSGAAGDDVLRGGAGDDHLDGGSSTPVNGMRNSVGGDAAAYNDATGAVTVSLSIAGAQSVGGGLGTDTLVSIENLFGGAFSDQITGDVAGNYLGGAAGNDTISGLGGGDVLDGGEGDDRIDGGADNDLASYAYATGGVVVDLSIASAQAVGGGMGVDTLVSIEHLYGSTFGDTLTGNSQDNYIDGQIGADSVAGGAGQDVLLGAAGADRLWGNDGDDTISGDAGNDVIDGGAGLDTAAFSGARTDYQMQFQGGTVVVTDLRSGGPDGVDTISGVEFLQFSDGVVPATPAILTLTPGLLTKGEGHAGATAYVFTLSRSGDMTAAVSVNWAVAGSSLNSAGSGDFAGGVLPAGTVNFAVGEADKTITVNVSGDTAFEPTEQFTLTLSNASAGAVISTPSVTGVITNDDAAPALHTVVGAYNTSGGTGSIHQDGSSLGSLQTYVGGANVDLAVGAFTGVAGLPTAITSPSTWQMFATALSTKATEVSAPAIQVFLNAARFLGIGGSGSDTFMIANMQAATIKGGAGDDVISTNARNGVTVAATADSIIGGAGDDTLAGGGGNDTLDGGADSDLLTGGAGSDRIDGGAGIDTASYASATAGVVVDFHNFPTYAAGVFTLSGDAGGDQFAAVERFELSAFGDLFGGTAGADTVAGQGGADKLYGNFGHDSLSGEAGDDYLDGNSGNDSLAGGIGADTLDGGADNDRLDGAAGLDTATYASSANAVRIDLRIVGPQATMGAGFDTLINIENLTGTGLNDTLAGDGGANILFGAGGNDSLEGDGGADSLTGGAGNDVLRGEAGADSLGGGDGVDTIEGGGADDILTGGRGGDLFVFGPGAGRDTLTDFRPGEDEVQFLAGVFTSFADMLAHAAQVGSQVVIIDGGGSILQLNNMQISNLQSADFVFA